MTFSIGTILILLFSVGSTIQTFDSVKADTFSMNIRVNDDIGQEGQRKPDIAVDDMGVIVISPNQLTMGRLSVLTK